MIYLQLFISYLKIGFFGFGGGYAMLSLIQNEVVVQNAWMTNAEFTDIVALSQMTPGPIAINSATYVGYTVAGFWGSVTATISVCLPALTLMILITRFFLLLRNNRYVKGLIAGMRPVVVGMIGAAALLLMKPIGQPSVSFIDWRSWTIFAIVCLFTVLPMFFKKPDSNDKNAQKKSAAFLKSALSLLSHPIILIVLAGVAGFLIYR